MVDRDYLDFRSSESFLQKRLKKAEDFIQNFPKVYCKYLYKDASKDYFDEIISTGLIHSQIIDIDDQKEILDSPSNHRKYGGIPFSATVRCGFTNGELIPFSAIGAKRLLIPVEILVDRFRDRLFFADFYDIKGQLNHNHYLILLIVKPDSKVCVDQFLELPLKENRFFSYDEENRRFLVVSSNRLYVRVHYTEQLRIRELLENKSENGVELTNVETVGKAFFYTKSDLRKLLNKALDFSSLSCMVPCKYLYRNKSKDYFDDIFKNNKGIMKQSTKGNGGDQRCPFHAGRRGLFFSATVCLGSRDGKPIPFSPYGTKRLQIPVELLIHGTKDRLYFADFYCLPGLSNGYHFVTLVVTKAGRTGCRDDLQELSPINNEFFCYDEIEKQFLVRISEKFFVEIFYTDEVDINKMLRNGAEMIDTPTVGRGCSVLHGIPKNKNCMKCNLDEDD